LHSFLDAGMNGAIDGGSSEAADLEKIPALRLELRHLNDLLLAVILEVDHHAPGTWLGDDAVKRYDNDARIAGLLDRAIQGVGRRGVDDDRIIALKDQVLDLGCLG